MKRTLAALALLLLSLPTSADDRPAGSGTLADAYAALLAEYRDTGRGIRDASTDLERKAAVERLGALATKLVELVEKSPEDPIALEVLRQAVQTVSSTDSAAQIAWETSRSELPAGSPPDAARRIVAVLLRHHVHSDALAPVCDRMRYSYRMDYERFLRTVLRANPHRSVRAVACISLAQFLNDRSQMVRLADDRPELTRCYEIVFGGDYLPELQERARDRLDESVESLLELAASEYGDVELRGGDTVGARARSELYNIRHLAVGKLAPDIEGQDQDGQPMRLSDYRGKVVLLYFWSEY